MRKIFFRILLLGVFLWCCLLTVQAANLTGASDYYVYGNDCIDKEQYEEALQAFRTARSMDERFYNEHYGISYQIGWVLNRLGRYEEALEEFRIAEKYRPEWLKPFAIYYNEGCVLARLGRNEEAIKAFDSSLMYEYRNRHVTFNKGIVLSRMGKYAEAVTAFDTTRKAYGSFLPLLGSFQEAAATYDRAQGTSPSMADISAPALSGTGSPQSVASDAYDSETSVDQLVRTGMDFVARYQYEDAIVVFDRVLKIDPSNYQAMDWRACALANLGRYEEADKMCDHALLYLNYKRHEDFYIDVYNIKAWVLAKQGKYNESIIAYDKAFVVDPDQFWAHYNKGWVLAQQGNYDKAVKEYDRSLDWENHEGMEITSHSILGPLGTYRDVMNAYDKTSSTQSLYSDLSGSPSYDVVIYQTDFSTDPHWQTSAPRLYYWDQGNKSYHFKSEASPGYAEIEIPYNGTPFVLEYDITIPHADQGALIRFGLSQYNTSENSQQRMVRYNSENVILGEFKSWRATEYRSIKDGDKTFQLYVIDSKKYASDPAYEGMCRINREQSIAIPSFGENRIYHVVIAFDPEKETISTKVTDNLHEKTYYVCSGMLSKVGKFHSMERLILVAEPAENAYIEGSIDNVVLSVPAAQAQTVPPAVVRPAPMESIENNSPAKDKDTSTPVTTPASITPGPSPSGNGTGQTGSLPSILTSPAVFVPIFLFIVGVIAVFIAADYLNKRNLK